MITTASEQLARDARRVYDERLKALLEPVHNDEFVAIEPQSGDFYLGTTLSEAVGHARKAHPDRLIHVMRVGRESAIHIGLSLQ
jgi:hypothetical protein